MLEIAMLSICFVCLGNICRSPTAEGVFLHLLSRRGLQGRVRVDSAGTAAYHEGERADPRSRSHARRRGYDLPSVARAFTAADFSRFDYVVAMDTQNLANLQKLKAQEAPQAPAKIQLFRDFDPEAKGQQSVPDPYYGGERGFEEVLDICERGAVGLLDFLEKQLNAPGQETAPNA